MSRFFRGFGFVGLCFLFELCIPKAVSVLSAQPSPDATVTAAAPNKPGGEAPPQSALPFIEDDYTAARRQAESTGRLLVVDVWAPWCHTCLSMRNFVLPDPLLRPLAQRFVYLAIDTEQPRNADFVARFPIRSWPTFLVLDVRRGEETPQVIARYTSAMTAAELYARLTEVASAAAEKKLPLTQADAAASAGRFSEAVALYARAATQKELRPQARLGQIQSLRALGQHLACAELGDAAKDEVGRSATATDFMAYATNCLEQVSDANAQLQLRQRLREHLRTLVHDPRAALSPDDRSDGYGTLIDLSDGLGDSAAGDRYAEERLQLLEAAAAQAPSPIAAATYDAHRLDCYRRLKRYAPAEAMLLASEKILIHDYNPSARLARLYFLMGRLDDALLRINRALQLAQGPARVKLLELKANIQHGLGQTHAALDTLQTALMAAKTQPSATAENPLVTALQKHIAAMRSTLPVQVQAQPAPKPEAPPQPKGTNMARRDP